MRIKIIISLIVFSIFLIGGYAVLSYDQNEAPLLMVYYFVWTINTAFGFFIFADKRDFKWILENNESQIC